MPGSIRTMFPGGAPDQETFDLMRDLDRMQTWATVLMTKQTPGAREAYDLCQRTRAFIVSRVFHSPRGGADAR
jgi:hypothetical protein